MFGFHFGNKESKTSMANEQAGDLAALRKNTRHNELLDRIKRLTEMVEKAGPNAEARENFKRQITETQTELNELEGEEQEQTN